MSVSEYELMQRAVDIVGTSPHPTNKIAAALEVQGFEPIVRTNIWPPAIEKTLGITTRIGNSSGTIHAETVCLLDAPVTEGGRIFITDPPCPNCVKNMAEAGIKALYIDHKGFDKDWAQRRGDHFDHMSMQICEKAGISVYVIHRKDQKIEPVLVVPENFKPALEKPLRIEKIAGGNISQDVFKAYISARQKDYGLEAFALCFARNNLNEIFALSAQPHPTIGFTQKTMEEPEGKYSFIMEPVNRLIMAASRHNLEIEPGYLYSSRVPTAREQVNMVGNGIQSVRIGDTTDSRDKDGLQAMTQLQAANVMEYI